jgi:hypothetical protein
MKELQFAIRAKSGWGKVSENELEEISPPHFPAKIKSKVINQYGKTPKAYATMWAIHNKMEEGDQRVKEMWMAFQEDSSAGTKGVNKQISDLLAQGKKVYSTAIGRVGAIEKVEGNSVFVRVNPRRMGVTTFDKGDPVHIEQKEGQFIVVNSKPSEKNFSIQHVSEHNEKDLSNPEEKREVEIAKEILKLCWTDTTSKAQPNMEVPLDRMPATILKKIEVLAKELLKMHGLGKGLREVYDNMEDPMFDDIMGRGEFANPGGNSALRAASKSNPRNRPCPTCGRPNVLTPKDVRLGYQCDACADAEERGAP